MPVERIEVKKGFNAVRVDLLTDGTRVAQPVPITEKEAREADLTSETLKGAKFIMENDASGTPLKYRVPIDGKMVDMFPDTQDPTKRRILDRLLNKPEFKDVEFYTRNVKEVHELEKDMGVESVWEDSKRDVRPESKDLDPNIYANMTPEQMAARMNGIVVVQQPGPFSDPTILNKLDKILGGVGDITAYEMAKKKAEADVARAEAEFRLNELNDAKDARNRLIREETLHRKENEERLAREKAAIEKKEAIAHEYHDNAMKSIDYLREFVEARFGERDWNDVFARLDDFNAPESFSVPKDEPEDGPAYKVLERLWDAKSHYSCIMPTKGSFKGMFRELNRILDSAMENEQDELKFGYRKNRQKFINSMDPIRDVSVEDDYLIESRIELYKGLKKYVSLLQTLLEFNGMRYGCLAAASAPKPKSKYMRKEAVLNEFERVLSVAGANLGSHHCESLYKDVKERIDPSYATWVFSKRMYKKGDE